MAASVLVDAGFLVALLSGRDAHHEWAVVQASNLPPPWITCEAAVSEAFHLMGPQGAPALRAILTRGSLRIGLALADQLHAVLHLMAKYSDVPASLADACLVRMTELAADSIVLTTDADFRVYRRHGRQIISARLPA